MLYALLGAILIINLILMFKMRDLLKMQNVVMSGDEKLLEALERLKNKEVIEEDLYLEAKALLNHSSNKALHQDEKTVMEFLYEMKIIDAIVLDEYLNLYKNDEV